MTRKVVVVGAGAAGLKATSDLLEAGLQVDLIDARARFGGRAWTDSSLGVPIDLGCQWLHDSPDNPWIVEAARLKIKAGKQIKDDYYFDPRALSVERSNGIRQHIEDLLRRRGPVAEQLRHRPWRVLHRGRRRRCLADVVGLTCTRLE